MVGTIRLGQVQSTPGFGSGVVQVQGTVDIGRLPLVDVGQRGDWKVSLATVADTRVVNTPSVTIALPPFVAEGGRYVVTWANGEREGLASGRWPAPGCEPRSTARRGG